MSRFGPYELRARPSTGGMAEVFHAIDTRTGAPCAIKRLLPGVAEDAEVITMFEDEARIASTLDHPNIARVLDFGAIDGQYFIAYELVDGVDLREIFDAASMASEPVPLPFVLHVFTSITAALAAAHDAGVVHRDVTPGNIVVSFEGDVKLVDFGIAKARGRLGRTGAGRIKGKLGYLSPEQVMGGPGEIVDGRTDLFSLGICMWELLTLKRLFSSPNEILVLDMVKHHVPESPSVHRPECGLKLDEIVRKALAKRTSERYRSARQLGEDLGAFGLNPSTARARIARELQRTFGPRQGALRSGSIMEPQETRMSDDNKSGSDLDIFEGLGKKSAGRVSAVPPPPPQDLASTAANPSSGSAIHVGARPDMKRTLVGIPGPAQPPSQNGFPSSPFSPSPSAATAVAVPASGSMPSVPSGPPAAPPTSQGRISSPPPLPSQSGSSSGSGISTVPPQSGSMRAATPSKPPPPPGRGSLPNLAASAPSAQTLPSASSNGISASQTTMKAVSASAPPPPPSMRSSVAPTGAASASSALPSAPITSPSPTGGKLDMDWDDDNEATHVFDKDRDSKDGLETSPPGPPAAGPESRRPEHASMDDILSSPRPQVPAAGMPAPQPTSTTTLSGFGALGQPRETNGASSQFRSGAPPSQSLRSAPPPPPASLRQPNASTSTAPLPPPPPPGQTTTVPMHMPVQPSQMPMSNAPGSMPSMPAAPSAPPHSMPPQQGYPSQPPYAVAQGQHPQPPMPQMPPVSRAMEMTAVVPRPPGSKAGLVVALLVGVVAAVAIAVFFVMPRTGTLLVNVADAKGGPVSKLEVSVDDKAVCDSAPCVVRDVQSGVHQVKVTAPGYDPPAPRAITIEARKDLPLDFSLSASTGNSGAGVAHGTGVKASSSQIGVRIFVDGKDYGALPQELKELTPGTHTVKFGSDRYAPVEKSVDVKQDELTDLGPVPQLKVLKGKATIQLGTPGAKVYLVNGTNRKEVPQFPIAIDFDPSEKWTLEAKMPGMEDYSSPISFDDGQAEKTIVVTLNPKGPATAQPPRTFVAQAPAPAPAPAAPKDTSGDSPAPKAATPAPAAPAAGEAFLSINSRPASTVLLDGKPLGPTPRLHVSVTPGQHTVLFVNAEESLKKSVTVTVAAGDSKNVISKLRE